MSGKDFWTAFYWGDYLRDTTHLSPEQHGCYILLLAHYYSTKEPLPADEKMIFRICRCSSKSEQKSALFVLDFFFVLEGGKYYNSRADKEIIKKYQLSETRKINAEKQHREKREKDSLPPLQ